MPETEATQNTAHLKEVNRRQIEMLTDVALAARNVWGQYSGHDVGSASGLMDGMDELENALNEAGLIDA